MIAQLDVYPEELLLHLYFGYISHELRYATFHFIFASPKVGVLCNLWWILHGAFLPQVLLHRQTAAPA